MEEQLNSNFLDRSYPSCCRNTLLPEDKANTLAGLVIEIAGNIPNNNDIYECENYLFKVISKKKNQITTVQVTENIKTNKHNDI